MNVSELIAEAASLPVEQRALVADHLLRSLNAPEPEVDRVWAAIATQRLAEIESGEVKPIPGDEVFKRIKQRFGK